MKKGLFILIFLITVITGVRAQGAGGARSTERGSFSLSNLSGGNREIADSLLVADTFDIKGITAFRLTPMGDTYLAPMDTQRLNSSNQTLVEAKSLAVGYASNYGGPAQTKIFSERKEARDFIFADAYDFYITTPENAKFYNTRIPYTEILYTQAGSQQNKDDHFKGLLTTNFGKDVNVGGEMDYIYSRGHYNSNGNKLLSYRIFGSYRSDKYQLNAYAGNFNFVNYENGGLENDDYLINPEANANGRQTPTTKDYPTILNNTWNRVRGKQFFLTHRYNLGYYRTITEIDEEGEEEEKELFVPVSSIIHTVDYEDNRRHFTSTMDTIDNVYTHKYGNIYGVDPGLTDRTSMWNLKNTVALSLREGFQDWVKFGLTAYMRLEKRRYKLPAKIPGLDYSGDNESSKTPGSFDFSMDQIYDEFSTYVGAELYKKQGALFTFNAKGELAVIGDDLGEMRLDGDIQSTFKLFKKEASVKATGFFRNVTPAFYQRHYHSRYFWWDESLKNIQHLNIGGEVHLASTRTRVGVNIESLQNYVYFGSNGLPQQYESNLQVITARLNQDFYYRAFGWENQIAYQLSSNEDVLPLPMASLHSNMYLHFRLFKVLTFQLGAELYYNTAYYAPYYEPATQQFQLQNEDNRIKVGNYPLMNAYLNMHLKQARFFIMGYNLSSKFVEPNHFSLLHYPLDPMFLKTGVIVTFNN
ncbi:MAG: putative porin [Tannerellaceae bacterium]|nr:putative porin [Tannerellaceae bacterium]